MRGRAYLPDSPLSGSSSKASVDALVGKARPVITVVGDAPAVNPSIPGVGSDLLDEIVRDGARRMLAAALEAEVAAYVD